MKGFGLRVIWVLGFGVIWGGGGKENGNHYIKGLGSV